MGGQRLNADQNPKGQKDRAVSGRTCVRAVGEEPDNRAESIWRDWRRHNPTADLSPDAAVNTAVRLTMNTTGTRLSFLLILAVAACAGPLGCQGKQETPRNTQPEEKSE